MPATAIANPGPWDLAHEVTRLRKSGDVAMAIVAGEEALEQFPDSAPVRSALAWALYDRDIKALDGDTDPARLRAGWMTCNRLHELLKADLYNRFSAWPTAVLRACSAMLDCSDGDSKSRPDAVSKMLSLVDPTQLSREGFRDGPSPMERHALQLTKALQRLGAWKELKQACLDALPRVAGCRDTELWLRRRLGLALLELDEPKAALPHLEHVLRRQPTQWWAHHNVGRARAGVGDEKGAIRAFATALQGGQLHMKTHVMVALADRLRAGGDVEDADRHHRVARKIRIDKGWKSTVVIDAPLGESTSVLQDDVPRLEALWTELTATPREWGRVIKVFEHGGAGFLELDRGERVYFVMPKETPAPPEGTRVTCRVVESFDQKKQQASNKAIDVNVDSQS